MLRSTKKATSTYTSGFAKSFLGDVRHEDWAYFAGLWDGEGCVTVSSVARPPLRRPGSVDYPYWHARLVISHTSLVLLQWVLKTFGGAIHGHIPPKRSNPYQRYFYQWHVTNRLQGTAILRGMLPYLKYKSDEAKLAIELFATYMPGRTRMEPKEVANRQRLVEAIRSLPGRRKRQGHVSEASKKVYDSWMASKKGVL